MCFYAVDLCAGIHVLHFFPLIVKHLLHEFPITVMIRTCQSLAFYGNIEISEKKLKC